MINTMGARQKNGGDEGDRTPDLGIANAALSQLSYIPTSFYQKGTYRILIICVKDKLTSSRG
jgi:hypothetical protein